MPHGWQLVNMVVAAAVPGSSSRAAHLASFSSGWAVMSPSVRTVLRSSTSTAPSGPTSSEPNGGLPASRACAASPMALLSSCLEKVGCAVLAVVRLKYAGSSHSPLRVRRIAQSAPHARPAVRHSVGASIGRRVAADTRSGDKPYGHPAGWMSFPTPTEGNPARWIPG
jgi:hypothetical protein